MYRLMLYYLIGLVGVAFVLTLFGALPFSPFALIISTVVLLFFSWLANIIFANLFQAPTKIESMLIAALVLALIISPDASFNQLMVLAIAAIVAMSSKYLLAINKRHIFNPAAFAVVITGFALGQYASWWVGTTVMLPFVLVGGLLLIRKMRRTSEALTFVGIVIIVLIITYLVRGNDFSFILKIIETMLVKSAFLFFAFVVLTEPKTSPIKKPARIAFSAVIALLYITPQLQPFGIVLTPELALCFGNIFSYIFSQRNKPALSLNKTIEITN